MIPAVHIRPAIREDCPSILDIYNEAVLTTTASYDYEPSTLERRLAWFDAHQRDNYAIWVAVDDAAPHGPHVIGWSSLSRFHDRPGYRFTCENSIYIARDWRGRGIGSQLMLPLIASARERGLHVIIAAIDASNEASLRLHARHGFQKVAHFREVGFKFGRWLDVVDMQLMV